MSRNLYKFSGTGVALVTPFRNYEVDYQALEGVIEHVLAGGVDYVVSLGTTGEAITLSTQECLDVLHFTIRIVDNRVPVVAGYFGSNYTDKLVKAVKSYNFDGVSGIMSSSPAYNKPPQEGIYQHYLRLAEVSPLPIIIYNVPGRTSSNIEAETIIRLAEASDKFVAVKEASGDLVQANQILKYAPEGFTVLSGDDPLTLALLGIGGHGAISVIANAMPAQFSGMVKAARSGDFAKARELNNTMLDIHPWLYVEGNPIGIKAALEIIGLSTSEVRIPLVSLTEKPYAALRKALAEALE